jgi:superoxide dismutase, Cu-Zn family
MRAHVGTGTLAALLVLSAGCVPMADEPRSAAAGGQGTAMALLKDAGGADKGRVTINTSGTGKLRLALEAVAMPPGVRAFHVHTTGRCDAPDFTTAGGHWNPAMKQHGRDNPMGAHAGDMPNLTIGPDGRGRLTAEIDGDMAGLLDADGAAVIVHAAPDDFRTDPTGNAGARIACGVVTVGAVM